MIRRFALLLALLVVTAVLGVALGSVRLPIDEVVGALLGAPTTDPVTAMIVWQVRLPRTVTAILAGAALSLAGVQMQTLFRNPLADPYILGVSSGASLGVALVVLTVGTSAGALLTSGLGWSGDLLVTVAACLGSAIVLGLVLLLGYLVRSSTTLLLLGVMIGYLVSAAISVLLAGAAPELIASYTRWRFGSYAGVTWETLAIIAPLIVVTLGVVCAQAKTLNALLLGERYATTLGIPITRARLLVVASASILAGTITAFCGPIQFLGIAMPHVARSFMGTSHHRVVLPASALIGASVALLADIVAGLPGEGLLPLNAVNALFGAPVVVWILLRRHKELVQ